MSLDNLDAQVRLQIEAGLARFQVERISLERLAQEGWHAQPDRLPEPVFDRTPILGEEAWLRYCQAGKDVLGIEVWAATEDGAFAAVVGIVRQGAFASVIFAFRYRRCPGNDAVNTLFYRLGGVLFQREGVETFLCSEQPLYDRIPAGEAVVPVGMDIELVRKRVEFHPLIRFLATPALLRLVLRLLRHFPSNQFYLQAGGLLRFHLEGLKPIEEQSWPGQLLKVRAALLPQPQVLLEGEGFEVTHATAFDVDALVDLHEACFTKHEHILVQLGRPFLQAVYRWFVSSPDTFVLVARRGDRILGLTTVADYPYNLPMLVACRRELVIGCLLHPWAMFNLELILRMVKIVFQKRSSPKDSAPEKVGQIAFTGVAPTFQGMGIGKALKQASIRICRERGMVAVSTGVRRQNPRARFMNEQAGFVEVPSKSTWRLIYLRMELGKAPAQAEASGASGSQAALAPGEPAEASREAEASPLSGPSAPAAALTPGPGTATATAPGQAQSERFPSHIVIVTSYYWPVLAATTQLMKDLAEGLAERGYRVTVLTNGSALGSQDLQDHPLLEGRILRFWNPFLRRMGVIPKVLEYYWFIAIFVLRGLTVRKIDLIFVASTPPLAGLPAWLLARLKGAKLVYNLQDIFPDSAVVAGMIPSDGRLYRWLRKLEVATYRCSNLVVSISSNFSDYVQQLVPGTQVATIPNWVDTDHIRPLEGARDAEEGEYRGGSAFVVQYAGNLGFMQNLEVVLDAAERLKEFADIRFVFIGDGNAKKSLQSLVLERGLTNCFFLPLQPLEKVPLVYNACDVGVIPLKSGAAQIAVPSKTWNYLSAGRPVIGCVEEDSTLARVIHESGSGSVVPPGDSARLAQVLLDYRNAPHKAHDEGRAGREYVETHLSRHAAIENYSRLFDNLLGKGDQGA